VNWLVVALAVQIGIVPQAAMWTYDPPKGLLDPVSFYQRIDVETTAWKFLVVGGTVNIHEWLPGLKSEGYTYLGLHPFRADFDFHVGVRFAWMEAGFRQVCRHPIVPYQALLDTRPGWDSAYQEAYVKLSWKLGG
jgi:hypothetical protein